MLGDTAIQLEFKIVSALRGSAFNTLKLPKQDLLFRAIAVSVAKAIADNNTIIEGQLRSAGIKL